MTTDALAIESPTAPRVTVRDGIHEIEGVLLSPYVNEDLAPARRGDRKWAKKDIAALWISMSACVPTYMLASSLIAEGMSWWQAVLTIFLGNTIVLLPMVLNAHAGTKFGIPFPVYCRAAFGMRGANVPAVLRALVACGWFGIQAWIGGFAIFKILAIWIPSWEAAPKAYLGISLPQLGCFLFFWGINMWVIHKGIESIRVLLNIKAPLLILLGLALLGWAYSAAGGFGPMFATPSAFSAGQPKEGQFFSFFFPALTGMIGFWATLSLNIPDFSRYAYSQRDQVVGQALGLPTTMGLYSFIGVAVTSATVVIYGETIWDLAGNVWEWVGGTVARKDEPRSETNGKKDIGWLKSDFAPGSLPSVITDDGQGSSMGYDAFRPSNPAWNATNGVGRIYHYSSVGPDTDTTRYGFIRGGNWKHGADDGAFTIHLSPPPNRKDINDVGFRCVAPLE